MSDMKIIAGLDIGNGYVKGVARSDTTERTTLEMPSTVAIAVANHDVKTSGSEIDKVMDDIYNRLYVNFDTPTISDTRKVFFGRRGLDSRETPREFDVESSTSKANEPLSYMLAFGCVAGKALQVYWEQNHALPEDVLHVEAYLALALPITEFKNYRKQYAQKLMSARHMVSIHNFETPVRVEITVLDAQIFAEGASAQYAINYQGEPLMNMMLADLRSRGEHIDPDLTAQDVLDATNTVGIDIGEGTVNFPVFSNGQFNVESSMTLNRGYGGVLNEAIDDLRGMGLSFNRKSLGEFLQTTPARISRNRHTMVSQVVNDRKESLVLAIGEMFTMIMNRIGAGVDVVYVYGGGATPMKETLYPELLNCAKRFGGAAAAVPILWLDSMYSQYLNREGLYIIADARAKSLS